VQRSETGLFGALVHLSTQCAWCQACKQDEAFSFNSRAQKVSMNDLALDLALVEGEIGAEGDYEVMTIDEYAINMV
jgi:hypothetical protein